jgi:hypothetical protein
MVHSRMIYSQNPSGELHVIDDINAHRRLCHYHRLIFLRKLHWSNFTTFCRGVFLRVLARGVNVDIGMGTKSVVLHVYHFESSSMSPCLKRLMSANPWNPRESTAKCDVPSLRLIKFN